MFNILERAVSSFERTTNLLIAFGCSGQLVTVCGTFYEVYAYAQADKVIKEPTA